MSVGKVALLDLSMTNVKFNFVVEPFRIGLFFSFTLTLTLHPPYFLFSSSLSYHDIFLNITFFFLNISLVERMVLNLSLTHSSPGDLRISILSPSGTESVLADTRAGPLRGNNLVCALCLEENIVVCVEEQKRSIVRKNEGENEVFVFILENRAVSFSATV